MGIEMWIDEDLRKKLRENAIKMADKNTRKRFADDLQNAINKII